MYLSTTRQRAYLHPTGPGPRLGANDVMSFAPTLIRSERLRVLLRKAGWTWQDIQFAVRDFKGEILAPGYESHLQYVGPRGEIQSARAELKEGGIASFPRFALKPNGMLHLVLVPKGQGPLLQGTTVVPTHLKRYLAFEAVQGHEDVEIRAANEQRLSEELEVRGTVGAKVLAVEASAGTQSKTGGEKTTSGEAVYHVRLGRPKLTIKLRRRG
jgi:hypothetical protein